MRVSKPGSCSRSNHSGNNPVSFDRRRRAHAEGVQKAPEGILPFYTKENNRRCKATTQVQTTADELLRLPSGKNRYELIRGELKTRAPAGNEHGALAALMTDFLIVDVRAQKLGKVYAAETGFKLASNPDTVRAPDTAFISQQRLDEVGPVQGYWPGAPDLAAEVVSPCDLYTEVSDKVAEWLEAGSGMVVVNPRNKQVVMHLSPTEVKVLGVDDTLNSGEVVPGWQLPIRELFDL